MTVYDPCEAEKDKRDAANPPPKSSRASGHSRIADVARLAEVSAQTVSRFYRDPAVVSAETSERIRRAAAALGYVPNLVAGSLASNRSRIVAIIVPTIANPAHSVWVQGMTDTLSPEGYQVLLGATNYDPVAERELVRTVLGRRVDGIAITGATLDPQAEALLKRAQIPAIQIFELPERPIDMAIGVRNEACGMAVADHLADRGYRRLAVVGSSALADTRAAGFSRQAIARGLPPPAVFVAEQPADVRCGPRLLAEILSATPAIEAVFCVGTQISVGLMLACPRAGVEVPGRLAIAGFSHGDIAAMLNPSLTTIRVPTAEMGQRAGAMLLMRLAGKAVEPASADAGYELVIGDST